VVPVPVQPPLLMVTVPAVIVTPVPLQPPLLMVTVPAVVVTPVPLQPPLLMVTVPALLVLVMVIVTVPAALQLPSRTGRSLRMGASVLATRRTLLLVQCRRCRPPHRERLCST
jgi:hypothetical protein